MIRSHFLVINVLYYQIVYINVPSCKSLSANFTINVILDASVSPNQDELKLALKQGTTLLGCIKEQAAKSENHKLNPDEMENQTTVERYDFCSRIPSCTSVL